MFYDILYPKVYGVVTLLMLTWSQFHQNVTEIEYPNLSQNEDKLFLFIYLFLFYLFIHDNCVVTISCTVLN